MTCTWMTPDLAAGIGAAFMFAGVGCMLAGAALLFRSVRK